MKLNGIETEIASHSEEILDNEVVIFVEDAKKIIELNNTAMLIWNAIKTHHEKNLCLDTKGIVNMFISKFNLLDSEKKEIYNDVESTINLLFEASLLKRKREDGEAL